MRRADIEYRIIYLTSDDAHVALCDEGPGEARIHPENRSKKGSSTMSRLRILSGTSAIAIAMIASSAHAQTSEPAAPAAQEEGAAIIVTGTRIQRPELNSNSPLATVGAPEIRYQGATNIESVLNRLPQFTADANENVSNGADGTANVNLRNLGSNRVLVLVNGQRMLPQQAVDLNFIPTALVERVDVVTGGASAVYGSDAIAGVVNFILRDSLDGLRIDAQGSFLQHNNRNDYVRSVVGAAGYQKSPSSVTDGGKADINAAFGKNFADGRGNITVYGGYHHADPVTQDSRDVSSCALDPGAGGKSLVCGGSSNNEYGLFTPLSGPNAGLTFNNTKDGQHSWVPYDSSFRYNYAPTNYFQRSDERYTAGGFAKFKFSSAAEAYGSVMYMRDHTFSQAAPSALFQGTTFTINCNNPFMAAAQAATLCGTAAGTAATADTFIGYRLTGPGSAPRRDDLNHNDYRYTAGLRGAIGKGFSYDVNYQRSLVRYHETYLNNVDNVKAQRALNVVMAGGKPTCQSVIDGTDPNCRPIDVFAYNGIDPNAYSYLYSPSNTQARNTQDVVSASLSGDLGNFGIRSPWAQEGVRIALGAEHRHETLVFLADDVAKQGGSTDSDGTITVSEGYGEIEVPLLQNLPFAHALTLNGGLRYSSYRNNQRSTGLRSTFTTWTYKGELNWAPSPDLRVRASYNHAMRAPNIGELFAATSIGNVAAQDPCSGASPTASLAVCQLTGVTAAQYGHIPECPADTCVQQGGGNRLLKPETGDTYTLGVILTPRALRRFMLSVDYFHIKVKDYIGSIDTSLTISQCVATSDPYYCGLFHRDPRNGVLFGTNGYVIGTTLNTGYLKTSGIDVNASYSLPLGGVGTLDLNFMGTWLNELVNQPLPGLGTYDCKGLFGYSCGQPSPEWRHQLRTTFRTRDDAATVSLAWRHNGATTLSSLSDNPALKGTPSVINARIGAYDYFDLAGTFAVQKSLTLRWGINNLLDKDPPAIAQGILTKFGNGNTYPGTFDPLGRTIFVGATVQF